MRLAPIVWVVSVVVCSLLTHSGWATHAEDLTDLTLDELLDVDVVLVNVLGGHTHLAGEWMVGHRAVFMTMDGSRAGSSVVEPDEILSDFPVAPTSMTMVMHMAEVMYAPTDNLTIVAMAPYLRLSMDHLTRSDARFTTESDGVGDTQLGALYTVRGHPLTDTHRLVLHAGLSLPLGSTSRRGDTPAGSAQTLPYPMQVGSGTFDLSGGPMYLGTTDNWAWGAKALATMRLGQNEAHYALGDEVLLNAWLLRRLTDWLAPSVGVQVRVWGNIDGANPALSASTAPTADPTRRGGERIDLTLGWNFYGTGHLLNGCRLEIEAAAPVFQSLDGPQLEVDSRIRVAWQWTF